MSTLWKWPVAAQFEKTVTKSRLGLKQKQTAKTKRLLTEHIERITWAYLLNPDSINLRGSNEVVEINVFRLALRTPTCPDAILLYIDRCIPKPILFELSYPDKVCLAATYKRPARGGATGMVTHDYYRTEWVAESVAFRQNLPHAPSLDRLYAKLLATLLPVDLRVEETLDDAFGRAAKVVKLTKEVERLRGRLRRERQFNLQIELNARVKEVEGELAELR